ncbi:MAG: hypothetical protein AABY22_05820 [Nanoarchaeota archaeon]
MWVILFWTAIFIFYCFHTYLNYRSNISHGHWLWLAIFFTMIPVFPLMARFSNNLLFDGLLYDLLMLLSYIVTLLYLGAGKAFNDIQWAGLGLTIIGFVLMKVRI